MTQFCTHPHRFCTGDGSRRPPHFAAGYWCHWAWQIFAVVVLAHCDCHAPLEPKNPAHKVASVAFYQGRDRFPRRPKVIRKRLSRVCTINCGARIVCPSFGQRLAESLCLQSPTLQPWSLDCGNSKLNSKLFVLPARWGSLDFPWMFIFFSPSHLPFHSFFACPIPLRLLRDPHPLNDCFSGRGTPICNLHFLGRGWGSRKCNLQPPKVSKKLSFGGGPVCSTLGGYIASQEAMDQYESKGSKANHRRKMDATDSASFGAC